MRRALSSESGFLGCLDLGLGRSGFPSLRDQGSGVTEERTLTWILGGFVEGDAVVSGLVHRKEELKSISVFRGEPEREGINIYN